MKVIFDGTPTEISEFLDLLTASPNISYSITTDNEPVGVEVLYDRINDVTKSAVEARL